MSYLRRGYCLVVWKLDRLGSSLKDLIEKVETLRRGAASLSPCKREWTPRRLPALGEGDIKLAQRMIQDPEVPVQTICDRLGISSATLYRYVAPDGSRRK
jgi:DNA invertase Pin-like site-specific DNA recombinase